MRQRIEVQPLWRSVCREAGAALTLYGEQLAALPADCPFDLADLSSEAPNAQVLVARLVPPLAGSAPPV